MFDNDILISSQPFAHTLDVLSEVNNQSNKQPTRTRLQPRVLSPIIEDDETLSASQSLTQPTDHISDETDHIPAEVAHDESNNHTIDLSFSQSVDHMDDDYDHPTISLTDFSHDESDALHADQIESHDDDIDVSEQAVDHSVSEQLDESFDPSNDQLPEHNDEATTSHSSQGDNDPNKPDDQPNSQSIDPAFSIAPFFAALDKAIKKAVTSNSPIAILIEDWWNNVQKEWRTLLLERTTHNETLQLRVSELQSSNESLTQSIKEKEFECEMSFFNSVAYARRVEEAQWFNENQAIKQWFKQGEQAEVKHKSFEKQLHQLFATVQETM